jgi:hypothetical protein
MKNGGLRIGNQRLLSAVALKNRIPFMESQMVIPSMNGYGKYL